MNPIIILIILTLLPFLELRASIPYGIFNTNLSITTIFLICIITNIILAPLVYFFIDKLMHFFLRIKIINKIYKKTVVKTQNKISPYIEKYGFLGLAVFIGIPLPGSGVYSGALGAYLLGFKFKDFLWASIVGVFMAGIIVLLISTAGSEAWHIFLKTI